MKKFYPYIFLVFVIIPIVNAQVFPPSLENAPVSSEIEPFYSEGEPGLWEGLYSQKFLPVAMTHHYQEDQENQAKKVKWAQPLEYKDRGIQTKYSTALSERKGALKGKFIYVSPGHGFTNYNGVWKTQRGNLYEMVEDHANSDQVCYFFLEYLLNAGATVIPLRDVGPSGELYIVDNDDPQFSLFGTWYESSGPIFWGDVADKVHYVYTTTSPTETSVARWTPDIKTPGYYPVFVWYTDGANRTTEAHYRIVHKGGVVTTTLDQYRVGKGWIWLGTYYFDKGTGGYVELSNQSQDTGKVVIADAVRFGSGVHAASGYPWPDMCAHEYMVFSKAPEPITSTSDVWCRPRMAAYMNNAEISKVCYISFHSNAHNGVARGAMVLKNRDDFEGGPAPYCDAFNKAIIHQVEDDLNYFWGLPRRNYQVYTSAYGELTYNNLGGEMAATIVEVAYHDNPDDANLLKTAGFRRDTARAVLQGIVDYFADTHKNAPKVYLPDAPSKVSAIIKGPSQVTISWEAPPYGGHGAHQATGYIVYKSLDGLFWDNGKDVGNTLSYNYTGLAAGQEYYFRVRAYNDGGISFPSETMGVRITPDGKTPPILIVSGFSRYDRELTPLDYDSFNGWSRRVRPWLINSFQYVVTHGKALSSAGYYFESTNNERVIEGAVNLAHYHAVVWILGRESDLDETLNSIEQSLIIRYLNGGGRLFISGEDIGWDLELSEKASQDDKEFLHKALQVKCIGNDGSKTNIAKGVTGSIFAGISEIVFSKNFAQGYYDTQTPDVFQGLGTGAKNALIYSDSGQVAAVQYSDSVKKVVVMGFPFEMIQNSAVRKDVILAIMKFFLGD